MSLTVEPPRHRATDTQDDQASPPARSAVSVARWGGRVVAWMVILTSLAALTVAVLVPRLGGATPYEILTGSMAPGLPPGTLVVMKPAGPGDIGVGSIVTYQLRSGEPTVVTHRVVEVRQSLGGDIEYVTQGDANSVADELPVRPEQIRGTLWYAVPKIGRINQLINGDQRQTLVYLAAAGLGAYALAMYAAAVRDRRRRSRASSSGTSPVSR